MSDQRDGPTQLAFSRGPTDPRDYSSPDTKTRFAVAKYYGMGSDGEWSVEEIADTLDVTQRQVYNYLNDSEIGRETREIQAMTGAEWRLDAALHLRQEIERLEVTEQELLQRTTTAPTDFEEQSVEGTPARNGQVVVSDEDVEPLTIPVPSEYQEITDYGPDLERIQKEKRNYIDQICTLLGLDDHSERHRGRALAKSSDRMPVVEVREIDATEAEENEKDD